MARLIDILLELVTILICVYVFVSTFEPLKSRVWKRPWGPTAFLLIRIGVIVIVACCVMRITMTKI
jgi:hypothetical protein